MSLAMSVSILEPYSAGASSPLGTQLGRWLDEPGVRVVVVELYSDYCEPCKAAAPRWEALRQRYASHGLKLVAINVDEYESDRQCKTLPWRPDLLKCDRAIAVQLGVCKPAGACDVPRAYVWSWQGELLVSGNAHVREAERAIRAYLGRSPRVAVEVLDASRRRRVDTRKVRRLLESELSRDDKIQLVVNRRERERLRARAKRSYSVARRDDQRCEMGSAVSENMVLRAEVFDDTLSLALQHVDKRCAITVVADRGRGKPTSWVRKAAYELMNRLTKRPPALPGAGLAAARRAPAQPPVKETWTAQSATAQRVVVRFESTPPGAMVMVGGSPVCQATPCSKAVPAGARQVRMLKERYQPKGAQVTLKAGETVQWTLTADFGSVSVTAPAPGVAVSVNGQARGRTPIRVELTPGQHEVKVDDPCYTAFTTTVTVRRGAEAALALTDRQARTRVSGVEVTARDDKGNDLAAKVSIDGREVGLAPGPFTVPLCSKQLHAELAGHRTATATLALREKQVAKVPLTLPSLRAARRAPDPNALLTGISKKPEIRPANLKTDNIGIGALLAERGVELVALDIYATWCKPCVAAVPTWKQLHAKYRSRGLRVVVLTKLGRTGQTVWSPDKVVADRQGRIADAINPRGRLPATYLWDRTGRQLVHGGAVADISKAVEARLGNAALPNAPNNIQIKRVMRKAARTVRNCVTAAGEHNVHVATSFMILPDGGVSQVGLKGPVAATAAAGCVKGAIRRLQFPPSRNGKRVNYPFFVK